MKAFHITEQGASPALMDLPKPEPAQGQVRLRIAACGLNFADLLMIKGQYQDTPEPPFTLGMEVAGTVDAIGADVTDWQLGDRVAVFGGQGGLAEYACYDADRCMALPETMDFTTAAGFQIAYGTSHLALTHSARLRPGETLLVLGAAGGVGLTAVEIGKAMGATVIAVARGTDKLEAARAAGADHLFDSDTTDLRAEVKALGGADVVYDPVGGDLFTAALRSTNRGARVLVIGFASGDIPPIPANILLVKNISVIGFYWGGYLSLDPQAMIGSMQELMRWHGEGKLHPHISHTLPLEQADEALELLRARKSTGKVVVTI
ncbi:NADPH:quinone oxidoreductase family protein [Cognatishimia sp. MH4019]|uniref:NADPH:quinone oxidoreductase family protein n=1 Tax=Cognatishimia sp. MH4019 TaxID=2854030 RepID=UPI001CD1F957|nr:NADPH:quinone oxidoreductase family protein [Cognatishimia sp. MH4019]